MTLMEFFGCTFIAFGPPFGLFVFTIARDPLRIIVLITSCFFWLLALLISSILWYAVSPLRDKLAFGLVFSVLFQELFRFLFYKMLRKADEGLHKVSQQGQDQHVTPKDISNKHIMAYVSGLGFGIISGAFSLINVLADMVGPGTIGIKGDSKYFFLASEILKKKKLLKTLSTFVSDLEWALAFLTLCFVLLHTFWGIIFFNAFDKKQYVYVGIVVASHMLVSCLSLLNQRSKENSHNYLGSIIPSYVVLVIMACIAFRIAGGTLQNIKYACMLRRTGRYSTN